MCIVKTNISHEKKKCILHFQRKQSFLSAPIQNYYKQESKIDHTIAANKFIYGTCRFVDKCRSTIFLQSTRFASISLLYSVLIDQED